MKNPKAIKVQVYWGSEWINPIEAVKINNEIIMARVMTRSGSTEMVRFKNTRKYKAWRLL